MGAMKTWLVIALVGITLLNGGGCNLITPIEDSNPGTRIDSVIAIPLTSYNYVGYDASGREVVRGTLAFHLKDSVTVEGSWEFEATGSTSNIGPQVGKGTLGGSAYGDTLFLNLNPGFADNNVILSGVLSGGEFSGTWSWIGFAGVITQGTFRASVPISGTWTWLRSAGGLWYHVITPPPARTAVFGTDSTVRFLQNDTLTAEMTYAIRREPTLFGPALRNVIHYADSMRYQPQTYSILGDTLYLSDLCIDCFNHLYVRKREVTFSP
jgi:hypothetical protein